MSDDCFDLAEELDRLRMEVKRLEAMKEAYKAESKRATERLDHVLKDWYDAQMKYGPSTQCDHLTLKRPDQICPQCYTGRYLTTVERSKASFSPVYEEAVAAPRAKTVRWMRDCFALDGINHLVWAWREEE